MTEVTRSLLSAASLLVRWDQITKCETEDRLRTAFMGAFQHARAAHLSLVLLREEPALSTFDKRIDLYLVPSWPPGNAAVAAGELKFFRRDRATDYRTRIGARLSDLHYVHCMAHKNECLHGFFLDVVLDPSLVGRKCYDSLKKMCRLASKALYDDRLPESELRNLPGLKAFATAAVDHTPRKKARRTDFGFLFPPMDLGPGRHTRGPAFVQWSDKNGLIALGVRLSGKLQVTPYRLLPGATDVAVCFAVFEPGGKLAADTNRLIREIEEIQEAPPGNGTPGATTNASRPR